MDMGGRKMPFIMEMSDKKRKASWLGKPGGV